MSDVVLYLSEIFHVLIDGDRADGRRALLWKPHTAPLGPLIQCRSFPCQCQPSDRTCLFLTPGLNALCWQNPLPGLMWGGQRHSLKSA